MRDIKDILRSIKSHHGKRAIGKALSISVLNQAVSSGTNFALGIYLVRMLPPAEFGLYGIGFAISLFYFGIGNALFLTQMVVHTPDKPEEERLAYAGRVFVLVLSFCAITLLLVGLVTLACGAVWDSVAHHRNFVVAVMAASVTYLLKDFFVRHAYNVRKESWALAIHCVIALSMTILLLIQCWFMDHINVTVALWIYTGAQAGGALLGFAMSRLPLHHRFDMLLDDLREALRGGKWASLTNLVYFARTQAHTVVVASLLGPVGVAKLNASRLLVTPAVMLTPALGQVAMPRLASVRAQRETSLKKLGRIFTFALLAVAIIYCTALLCGYDIIVARLWGEKYTSLFGVTALWCLYTCLLAVRNGTEMIGQVLKEFKKLSHANTYSAIVSLVATYLLTISYGLPGALIGLTLGEIAMTLLIRHMLKPLQKECTGRFNFAEK